MGVLRCCCSHVTHRLGCLRRPVARAAAALPSTPSQAVIPPPQLPRLGAPPAGGTDRLAARVAAAAAAPPQTCMGGCWMVCSILTSCQLPASCQLVMNPQQQIVGLKGGSSRWWSCYHCPSSMPQKQLTHAQRIGTARPPRSSTHRARAASKRRMDRKPELVSSASRS